MTVTIICYVSVLVLTFLGVPSLIVSAIGTVAGPVVSSCLVWGGMAYAWRLVEGGPLPLAIYVAAFLWVGWSARDPRLTALGHHFAGGEQWGILLSAVIAFFVQGGLRWY